MAAPNPPPLTPSSRGGNGSKGRNVQVVCRFRPAREKDPFAWFDASGERVRAW